MPTHIPYARSSPDRIEHIRQVLRHYVDYHHKEATNIYANRPVDKDSYLFHLFLPIMVEFEISGTMLRTLQDGNDTSKLINAIVASLDAKKSDLNQLSQDMSSRSFVFPDIEGNTVMEFSL